MRAHNWTPRDHITSASTVGRDLTLCGSGPRPLLSPTASALGPIELGEEAHMRVEVGMDVHPKRSQVAVVDEVGVPQRNRNVPNDPADAAQLVPILGASRPGPGGVRGRLRLGWLVELLQELELEPHLVHPSRCKAIASARLKNDKVDAATLAQLLRADLLPEAWIAPRPPGICGPCCGTQPPWCGCRPPARTGCRRCSPTEASRTTPADGPVLGEHGWPAWSCRRPHGQSLATAAGCWTPWPARSLDWTARSPDWPSQIHGSRRS
jgi:hypothetical protein